MTESHPPPMSTPSSSSSPPYLCLTVPEALALASHGDDPDRFDHVPAMLARRASRQPHRIAAGFAERRGDTWHTDVLAYSDLPLLAVAVARRIRTSLAEVFVPESASADAPVVALLAPSSLVYLGYLLACWQLGVAVLPIAIGTTDAGVANLLRLTSARTLLVDAGQLSVAAEAQASLGEAKCQSLAMESKDEVLAWLSEAKTTSPPPQVAPLSPLGGDQTLVIFHSSGSTGLPKPIPQPHRFWCHSMLDAEGHDVAALTTTPLYHGGLSDLLRAVQAGAPLFFYPLHGSGALTAASLIEAARACERATAEAGGLELGYFLSVPFILELLADAGPAGRQLLRGMRLVSTGGAPLAQATGDSLVADGVHLVSRLGSSECGFLLSSYRDFDSDAHWSWLREPEQLPKAMRGLLRFEDHASEAAEAGADSSAGGATDRHRLAELVVTAQSPTKLVSNRPNGDYATGDLYEAHAPGVWRYFGRADDALMNGKKVAAGLVEDRLRESEVVRDAVVFGANRALLGALVVPSASAWPGEGGGEERRSSVHRRLRPHLVAVNGGLPAHARVAPELVRVLAPDEAESLLPRSSKGTLQRRQAYARVGRLVDETYDRFERGEAECGATSGRRLGIEGEELRAWLANAVEDVLGGKRDGARVGGDEDLHGLGVDSVMAARIRAAIHQNIDLGGRQLSPNVVYEHPSIEKLAKHLEGTRHAVSNCADSAGEQISDTSSAHMIELVSKYANSARGTARPRHERPVPEAATVVLTGATGALGAHLLDQLRRRADVDAVICLVRASDDAKAASRVSDSLETRQLAQLDAHPPEAGGGEARPRVECWAARLGERDLGLDGAKRARLSELHHCVVVHAAWSVNFALGLGSFEAECIAGTRRLLDLAQSALRSTFLFCSSVASVLAASPDAAPHAEARSEDPRTAGGTGYGQSKWVAEAVCDAAARRVEAGGSHSVRVARIGQLCADTVRGVWNETEAWPLLVRTADEVGALPEIEQPLDWLPVDTAAAALLDIAFLPPSPHPSGADFFHVALPTTTTTTTNATATPQFTIPRWPQLLGWLWAAGVGFEALALSDWLARLEARPSQLRGAALLPIWRKLTPQRISPPTSSPPSSSSSSRGIDVRLALQSSPHLRQARAVDGEHVARMVRAWRASGFLQSPSA